MTNKDYEKFANMVRFSWLALPEDQTADKAIQLFKKEIADIFAQDNSECFDRERFYDACKPKKG